MSTREEKITGKRLNEEWNVWAEHALYRKDGTWYHNLTKFPGAFFDAKGYVLFDTEDDYRNCKHLQLGAEVHVPGGISSIPAYVYMTEEVGDNELDDVLDTEDVEYEGGAIYPYDMPSEVDIREQAFSVFEWMRKLKDHKLIIDPEFQRNRVWKPIQKSQFIESVLLNIPLPPLYVNQKRDGTFIIVDGLQRTTTLDEFINDQSFALSGLKVLDKLNTLKFRAIDQELQSKIEDKKFLVYVIRPTVPLPMVYDIFHRINTGGTQLSRQEIRNCFYIGPATRFLKELSEKDYFRAAIDNGISPRRMKDREAILRCLAFRILNYEQDYKNDMDAFLGEALNQMSTMGPRLSLFEEEFERVMKLTFELWGPHNFRLPTKTSRGRINIALMESVYSFFASHENSILKRNKRAILKNHGELLRDSNYLDAIQFSTGDTKRVVRRFEIAHSVLGRF